MSVQTRRLPCLVVNALLALSHHHEVLLPQLLLVGEAACVAVVLELAVLPPLEDVGDAVDLAGFAGLHASA